MYQNKLQERERRKQVSNELSLVENFFKENPYNAMTGKMTIPKPKKKDSRQEVLDKFKFVTNIQSIDEYKKLMASVSKEKEIKYRIKELQRYRKNGINNLTEADSYEAERLKRNKKKAERKRALESGGVLDSQTVETGGTREESKTVDLDNISTILNLPGYEVLSLNEKRLCTSLRLHPKLYISYKTCLLRDHLQKKKGQSPKPVSSRDSISSRILFMIFLFRFILQGWIKSTVEKFSISCSTLGGSRPTDPQTGTARVCCLRNKTSLET